MLYCGCASFYLVLVSLSSCQAYVVLGQFLIFKKNEELFKDWLKETCGATSKCQSDCYACLSEWCSSFLWSNYGSYVLLLFFLMKPDQLVKVPYSFKRKTWGLSLMLPVMVLGFKNAKFPVCLQVKPVKICTVFSYAFYHATVEWIFCKGGPRAVLYVKHPQALDQLEEKNSHWQIKISVYIYTQRERYLILVY